MPAILGANSVTGYDVDNSLLFNSADNAELSRTLGSASGEKVFSFSTTCRIYTNFINRNIYHRL